MAPELKTVKNSKLPKLRENYFERVGKGGWPLISTWIIFGTSLFDQNLSFGYSKLRITPLPKTIRRNTRSYCCLKKKEKPLKKKKRFS
jgi:hypothetical protein